MKMQMTLRWFGPGFDTVPLEYIRQIPGIAGVVTTLYDMHPGEVWQAERVRALVETVRKAGLEISGIESINIHDSIKAGLPHRDLYISNYIKTLEIIGRAGIRLVCYNFMPVFDWTRSHLAKVREDGATVFSYDQSLIDAMNPDSMFEALEAGSGGFLLPGWEPARMATIRDLFEVYRHIDTDTLFDNLRFFLKAIMPVCEQYGIKMAIHPDDPPWPVFGLPRIVTSLENLTRLVGLVDSPYNGITLCTGSLGADPANDLPAIIRALRGKIHFAHLRNIRRIGPGRFDEAAHLSDDGSIDMLEIVKTLYESGFDGIIRPDHGRGIWGEKSMPGYGLYDRALGAMYITGLWEAVSKISA